MGEDASLDDFLGGESSEQSGAGDTQGSAADPESADTETAAPAAEGVERAATTYAWSDEGATCEACGETVERRWQQAGELVCIECKDWERA